ENLARAEIAERRAGNEALHARDAEERSTKLSAELALELGLNLCERGDVDRGLLWMSRALLTSDDKSLQRAIRLNLDGWRRRLHPLRGMLEHSAAVCAISITPDGGSALIGGADGTARFWSVRT